MSMDYSHLLVPLDPQLVFDPIDVARFLEEVAAAGHVGGDPERHVRATPILDGGSSSPCSGG